MTILYAGDQGYRQEASRKKGLLVTMDQTPVRVISVTSGKGGVGKTHITVNLGIALSKMGKRVLLIDADLGLANINIVLGFQPTATLRDVIAGEADLKDIIVSHDSGIDIIPAASGIQEMAELGETERIALVSAIDQLEADYDYVLIDTAAGIGSNVMYFNTAAQDIFVVIDHEPTSLTDAYALIKVLATEYGMDEFNVVVNRTPTGITAKNVYAQLCATTDKFLHVRLKYFGSISYDSSVSEAIVSQQPFMVLYPGSRASHDLTALAKKIEHSPGKSKAKGGMQFFLKSLVEHG